MREALLLLFLLIASSTSHAADREKLCADMVAQYLKGSMEETGPDMRTDIFYSEKYDSCVYGRIASIGADAEVRDVSRTIIRDWGVEWAAPPLFDCSPDGANVAILNRVKQYRGNIFNRPYDQWLDDGEGGPPATLQTPPEAYTRQRCERLYDEFINQLR